MTIQQHTFGLLTLPQLESAWPQVRALLAKCDPFSNGGYLADDFLDLAREDRAHIFVLLTEPGIEAAMAVTFTTYPRMKVMTIAAFGGKHTRLIAKHYTETLEQFARDCGASRVVAWCRPSAARLFCPISGMETVSHLIAKDLV